jgi:hypothetical protein
MHACSGTGDTETNDVNPITENGAGRTDGPQRLNETRVDDDASRESGVNNDVSGARRGGSRGCGAHKTWGTCTV